MAKNKKTVWTDDKVELLLGDTLELKALKLSDEVDLLSRRLKFADILLFRFSG